MAFAEANKDRRSCDVAHRDIRNGDVLDVATVNSFDREAAAMHKIDVRDRDVLKTAVRFCTQLYSSRHSIFVRRKFLRCLVGAVEHRAELEHGDL